ncbi:MAG TPA: hypothetical protein VEB01_17270 [Methylocaldum sp.]|nr:hypothetical protein [Methylocaldum sp.]
MFKADRVFSERNNTTGQIEWFFLTREGVMGPYESEAFAKKSLDEFKQRCIVIGADGGRTPDSKSNFELVRDESGLTTLKMDPVKSK